MTSIAELCNQQVAGAGLLEFRVLSKSLRMASSALVDSLYHTSIESLLLTASALTDPLCRAREVLFLHLARTYKDMATPPAWPSDRQENLITRITNLIRKTFIIATVASFAGVGLALRITACRLMRKPFFERAVTAHATVAPPQEGVSRLTIVTQNTCLVPAGFTISDGGVSPGDQVSDGETRTQRIAKKILENKPSVVCLSEVFDLQSARLLIETLGGEYHDFRFHMGPRATGLSSGLFVCVAKEYAINGFAFHRFPDSMLYGNAKGSSKGFCTFGLTQNGHELPVTIATTHMQHSEQCNAPIPEETRAREQELGFIFGRLTEIQKNTKYPCVLTGDFNAEPSELKTYSCWRTAEALSRIVLTLMNPASAGQRFWGGDAFSRWVIRDRNKPSPRLELDHAIALSPSEGPYSATLYTAYSNHGFNPKTLNTRPQVLSDHPWALTHVTIMSSTPPRHST